MTDLLLRHGDWDVVNPASASWRYLSFRVERLRDGDAVRLLLDAQRQELFAARYDVSNLAAPRLTEPFQICAPSEAADVLRMDLWTPSTPGEVDSWIPKAETLAGLAAHRTDFTPGAALDPIYLRKAEFVKAPPSIFSAL